MQRIIHQLATLTLSILANSCAENNLLPFLQLQGIELLAMIDPKVIGKQLAVLILDVAEKNSRSEPVMLFFTGYLYIFAGENGPFPL